MIAMLERMIGTRDEIPDRDPSAPASEYAFRDGIGRLGFVRLTSDGKFRYCLFAIDEIDVNGLLHDGSSDEPLMEMIRETVRAKWIGHEISVAKSVPPPQTMQATGW